MKKITVSLILGFLLITNLEAQEIINNDLNVNGDVLIEDTSSTNMGLTIFNDIYGNNQGNLCFYKTGKDYIVTDQRNAGVIESYNDLILSAAAGTGVPMPSIKFQTGRTYTTGNTRMIIDNKGNVGIGLNTPGYKLDIRGGIAVGDSSVNSNTTKIFIRNSTGKTWAISSGANMINETNFAIYDWTDHGTEAKPIPYFGITQDGNVGIGVVTPAYKLDVLGTIRAQEVKVDLNGADFVFENNYKLRSLTSLEQYVKENKHLPGIESADKMEADGTDLGALNTKLLQKVEELTLYIIKQNKKITALEKANTQIEKQSNELELLRKKIEELELAIQK